MKDKIFSNYKHIIRSKGQKLHGNVLQYQNSVGFESMRYMGSVTIYTI